MRRAAAILLTLLAAAFFVACSAQPVRFDFEAEGLTFEAALERPAVPNGWGVLLMGGGLAHDLDWSVPAEFALYPAASGDAAILSRAFAARGFAVVRWSTLALDDPLRGEYPLRATPRTHEELLAQARTALGELVRRGGIEGNRIIVAGHSLGAYRALRLAGDDCRIAGAVLLAPARLARRAPGSAAEHAEDFAARLEIPILALAGGKVAMQADQAPLLAERVPTLAIEVRRFDELGHTLGREADGRVGPLAKEAAEAAAEWAAGIAVVR